MTEPKIVRGREQVTATCETCRRSWTGSGRKRAQRAVDRAQAHLDLTGHRVGVEWKNRP